MSIKSGARALVVAAVVAVLFVVAVVLAGGKREKTEFMVVATSFPGYDFARAVVGEGVEVKMLLKPGAELHDYEPTPQDIRDIQESDLFIYVGGESDEWVEGVLTSLEVDAEGTVRMMDLVKTVVDDDGDELDEHVWTSPVNAAKIVEALGEKLSELMPEQGEKYMQNATKYKRELMGLDTEIREVVARAKQREVVFGDRFPLKYFADEYGLLYFAAFPGCAEQTEVSAEKLAFLIDKVRTERVPVVFRVELSDGKIAAQIAEATGAKVREFQTAHNVSREDFEAGVTYADLMRRNVEVLREALGSWVW